MSESDKRKTSEQSMRLAILLLPFVWGAVAINLFMLGLLFESIEWALLGAEGLSPYRSMLYALVLAFPVNWLATRWVQSMLREAGD